MIAEIFGLFVWLLLFSLMAPLALSTASIMLKTRHNQQQQQQIFPFPLLLEQHQIIVMNRTVRHDRHINNNSRNRRDNKNQVIINDINWPRKSIAVIEGDLVLGGLMMIHEREETIICGPIMPQGGIQALEMMLFTIDHVNKKADFLPGFKLGAHVLDDCDTDTYGLEQAVEFIKGPYYYALYTTIHNVILYRVFFLYCLLF
jgi:hypothetical protein